MGLEYQRPDEQVVSIQRRLIELGYGEGVTVSGYFDEETRDAVELFQMQHIGPTGRQLAVDGVVGENTLWALRNPTGDKQRNFINVYLDRDSITKGRLAVLDWALHEHGKGVKEVPLGSNRSADIDLYWGPTGVIGKPWCCAFVSNALVMGLHHYPIAGKHHLGVQRMLRAAAREGLVVDKPKPGDIFVMVKASGKGHTGLVLGVSNNDEYIITVEGNCGNRVKVGRRLVSSVDHFIDPYEDDQTYNFTKLDSSHLPNLGSDGTV